MDCRQNLRRASRIGLIWNLRAGGLSKRDAKNGTLVVLRAAHRYAYSGCGSTAYSYLPRKRADTYRHKKTLSVECLSRAISWSLPAEPFQLVPAQLRACESPPKRGLFATGGRSFSDSTSTVPDTYAAYAICGAAVCHGLIVLPLLHPFVYFRIVGG